eukprot:6035018-Amphidinium_carterae.3
MEGWCCRAPALLSGAAWTLEFLSGDTVLPQYAWPEIHKTQTMTNALFPPRPIHHYMVHLEHEARLGHTKTTTPKLAKTNGKSCFGHWARRGQEN